MCALGLVAASQAQTFHLVDITSLFGPGGATDINNSGQIAGTNATRGGLYNGKVNDMGTLGGNLSAGSRLNSAGAVTGYALDAKGMAHAVRYENGTLLDLGIPFGFSQSFGLDINDSGMVAGYARSGGSVAYFSAFAFDGKNQINLGTLGGKSSIATAINNSGVIAGYSLTANAAQGPHAFIFDGKMRDLGTLGGDSSQANDINANGFVVGTSGFASDAKETHAFMWNGKAMLDLGTLGFSSTANAINDLGVIVGNSYVDAQTTHGFIYRDGAMLDLNKLTDASLSNWIVQDALGINSQGQILATAFNMKTGTTHSVLLNPVPEPTTVAGLALGAMALIRRRKKK